jgi:Tol biopolymer transport system component
MKTTKSVLILALAACLGLQAAGKAGVGQQSAGELFEKALFVEEGQGDLQKAIGLYQDIVKRFPGDRETAAKALLHIGLCYERLGLKEAEKAFRKVVSDFPEQTEAVKRARGKLSALVQAKAALEKGGGEIRIRKVWDSAVDSYFLGSPSPDGRLMTYVDWDNFANLGVRDLATGESRLLTNNKTWESGEMCYQSVFSPDGDRIAFAWQTAEGLAQLRIIGTDGSGSRVLNDGKDASSQGLGAWSRDGKQILAYRYRADRTIEVILVSVDDGQVKPVKTLTGLGAVSIELCLSPDARYIAYSCPRPEDMANIDIFAVSADGSRETTLISHPAEDVVLGWDPDGKHLLFKSDRTGSTGLWSIAIAEGLSQGEPRLLKTDLGAFSPLGLTKDGRLFYGLHTGWSDIFVASLDPETGKVLSRPVKTILRNEGRNSTPDWSPDGEMIACRTSGSSAEPGRAALFLHSLRTGETQELTLKKTGSLNFHFLRWSPDGRRLLCIGSDEKGSYGALHAVEARTGDSEIIARSDDRGFIFGCDWAPDGKSLYFLRRGKEGRSLIRLEVATGKETALFQFPNTGHYRFSLSPDGREVALTTQDKLSVYPIAGGKPRDLVKAKDINAFTWTRDGNFILYGLLRKGTKRINDLWRVPAAGGEAQKLDIGMINLMHMRVHPDGQRVVFTAGERPEKAEVWVLENFLPAAPAAQEEPTQFRVRKVWDKADSYFMGAPSPDGRYLTYADEYLSLGVRDLAKGENRFLLQNKSWANVEYCYNSIFSPDGGQVAYICQVKDRLTQLRIVNADGTSTRVLRDGQDRMDYLPFGWTSDGKYILTHCSGSPDLTSGSAAPGDTVSSIGFISALDGSIKKKKDLPFRVPWAAKMSLSPDERYVAGTYLPSKDSAAKDIFLLAVEENTETTLVEHPADDIVIGWSPDGRQALFTSDRTGAVGIWAVRVSEGKAQGAPELVRANLGNLRPLGLSRDGKLYYGISTGFSDVFIAPIDPATGKVLGPPVKAVRKYETFNASPDWSPDGQFLACHSTRGVPDNESPALLIRSLRTGEVRELTLKTPGGRLAPYYLRWSPDGRTIIGTGRDEEGHVGALLSVDARTGEAKVLARADNQGDGTGNIIALDWSADGRSINFVRIGKEFRRICNLDLETGIEKEIGRYSKASGPFWLASSADGKQLAFYAEGKLKILSRGDAAARDLGVAGDGMVLAWMPDGKTILYGKAQDGSQDVIELWSIPASGGQPRKTGLSMSRLLVPRVSPNGKQIAFMASEQPSKSEIWVMENFLGSEKSGKH